VCTMHSSAMLFSVILPLVFCPMALAAPEVNIGRTTLVGRDVAGLKQDFFGGKEQFFNE
jgi:acetylcholinesterase